jgi:hypothetical protein
MVVVFMTRVLLLNRSRYFVTQLSHFNPRRRNGFQKGIEKPIISEYGVRSAGQSAEAIEQHIRAVTM